ncbi:DsbA family protein [Isobaculum melis]|uniref:Thioredoxin n=1 Tax=Isobaculum melis TaxID=142588 RepID=A0A1H9QIQ3_9LACT|nr:DsbA family protein [Isobaculum melis]SER60065.1 Thioredoxin [Isobaculum melis]
MDISVIDGTKVTTNGGLHIGEATAPVKIIEFVNVRCPFCRKWFEQSKDLLDTYVKAGKVERIIKFFDKEKPSLQRGNVFHHYLDYHDATGAYTALQKIYETQDTWGNLELDQVADFAENELHLTKQDNQAEAEQVIQEALAANITLVPTVILNEHIFDEHMTNEELKNIIENA